MRASESPGRSTARYLRLYVQDHEGASSGGVRLAQRSARSNQGTPFGDPLADLVAEITQDQQTLRRIAARLGIPPSRTKRALAWLGVTLGAVKLNGRLIGYSPLSRIVELEGLSAGVMGKRRLWESLRDVAGSDPRLDRDEFSGLMDRAGRQLESIAALHDSAARLAFVVGDVEGDRVMSESNG